MAVFDTIRRFPSLLMIVISCVLLSSPSRASAQSGSRQSDPTTRGTTASGQLLAAPKPQGRSPFLPTINRDLRLPVSIKGFCLVNLRDHQKWLGGSEANQHLFDGQLYWFVGQRERAIFAANPRRYVPALGGDCIVTFAESGQRVLGDPRYGILHNHRLYFFVNQTEQELFRANPDKYSDVDLALEGRCLVSQTDDQQQRPGLPETTILVDGFRYQFAGAQQQRSFLNDMARYGVQRHQRASINERPASQRASTAQTASPEPTTLDALTKAKPPKKVKLKNIENKAMSGYCPVSIRDQSLWVLGDPRFRVEFDGLTYLMASENEQLLFSKNPLPYIPALGGSCVVTEINENRRVPGSIYYAARHEGEDRLFLFAGAEQKQTFNDNPDMYLSVDLAAGGKCVVALRDEGEEVDGAAEFMSWHAGKRYYFSSDANRAKFEANVQHYEQQ